MIYWVLFFIDLGGLGLDADFSLTTDDAQCLPSLLEYHSDLDPKSKYF
jgi:hypothetical protein